MESLGLRFLRHPFSSGHPVADAGLGEDVGGIGHVVARALLTPDPFQRWADFDGRQNRLRDVVGGSVRPPYRGLTLEKLANFPCLGMMQVEYANSPWSSTT